MKSMFEVIMLEKQINNGSVINVITSILKYIVVDACTIGMWQLTFNHITLLSLLQTNGDVSTKHQRICTCSDFIDHFQTWIQGSGVDSLVPLCSNEVQLALVAERAPLSVDDHVTWSIVICEKTLSLRLARSFSSLSCLISDTDLKILYYIIFKLYLHLPFMRAFS